jgi:hypothetical protein
MSSREFPFSPRSATTLEVGDVLAILCEDGTWAALQVSALRRTGPGARTTFGVGVLPRRGQDPPTAADVAGLEFVRRGLTGIEIFSAGGAEVVTSTTLAGGVQPNLHDMSVGTGHSVWDGAPRWTEPALLQPPH